MLVLFGCGTVLLAVGCGSSSHRLSESQFRSRANDICGRLNRAKPNLAAATKASLDQNLGRIDSALGELRRLRPPAQDEKRYQALLTRFKRSIAFIRANESRLIELTRKVRANPSDSQALTQYRQLVSPVIRDVDAATTGARALGLDACASGLSGTSTG